MRNLGKSHWFGIIYGIMLAAFTAYALLDVFVIPHRYETALPASQAVDGASASESGSAPTNEADDAPDDAAAEKKSTDTEYADGNITISVKTLREDDTDIYVADVELSSAEYLKTALAENTYGRNVKESTSAIAQENNAILAINGDFYGSRLNGYVIRNGVLYRSSAAKGNEDLVIYADGSLGIIEESEISAEALLDKGAQQVLSFGPALIENGDISVSESEEVGKAKASNPRTAIGLINDLHYVFVVSDGRTSASKGLSLYELARFMKSLGVKTAYNLDGGGSSTMYYQGRVINNPTTDGRTISERRVSDIVYIGYGK